jgi:hypothetical protein
MRFIVRLLWRVVRFRLLLPMMLIGFAGQVWMSVRPTRNPLDERRLELADEVAGKLAESLPRPAVGRPTLIVMPFDRDPTGSVTDAVCRAIERVDRYAVQPRSLLENLLRKYGTRVEAITPEEAETLVIEDTPAEFVLAGRVQMLSARSDMDEAAIEGVFIPVGGTRDTLAVTAEAPIADRSTGVPITRLSRPVRLLAETVRDHTTEAQPLPAETYPWPARLITWLLVALLLPLVATPLVSRGLEKQSNAVNLLMLLGLTSVAGVTAFAMVGFQLDTIWGASLLVAGTGLAFAYNWLVLAKVDELRV